MIGHLVPGKLESFVVGDPCTAVHRALVIVSLHGDEPCGVMAVNSLVDEGFFDAFEREPGSCNVCSNNDDDNNDKNIDSNGASFGPVALALSSVTEIKHRSGMGASECTDASGKTGTSEDAPGRAPRCPCEMSVEVVLGNPAAYAANKRFLACNMNRLLHPNRILRPASAPASGSSTTTTTAKTTEATKEGEASLDTSVMGQDERTERTRAAFVMDAIDRCDAMLDLHSCSAQSPPFALPALAGLSSEAAMGLPTAFVIDRLAHCTVQGGTSLDRFCENAARKNRQLIKEMDTSTSTTTSSTTENGQASCDALQMREAGRVNFIPGPWVGVTLECGRHDDPSAPIVAARAIRAFLTGRPDPLDTSENDRGDGSNISNDTTIDRGGRRKRPKHLVSDASVRVGADFSFERHWPQFARVEKGTVVCTNAGVPVKCTESEGAYIVMPARDPREGEEAFFWGVDK